MRIKVVRKEYTDKSTIGELYLDGLFFCYTLEDKVRPKGEKIYGKTAIPAGIYMVQITYSKHFDRKLPILLDVPKFEGVRIHPGNTDKDTEGCILVGRGKGKDIIYNSKLAFRELYDRITTASGLIYIEIEDTLGPYKK